MNEVMTFTASFAAGAGLGLLYFFGLWETVRRLPQLRWAPLWLLLSLVLRLALLLGGLYWVGAGDWRRFVAALAGILLMRLLLTRQFGRLPPAMPAQASRDKTP